MPNLQLPPLPLDEWRATRDTIQGYSQVLGAVRAELAPRQKHSGHRSLRVAAVGLTTAPIPHEALTFEMLLDFTAHQLALRSSRGQRWETALCGQSPAEFSRQARASLDAMGVERDVDLGKFSGSDAGTYDTAMVGRFWSALSQIDGVLKRFKGEQRRETSEVQLWPHHFDIAMLWFSGRLAPGTDASIPRNSDEQMNFGFSTGDASIPEPYFYATVWPRPEGLSN